MLSLVLSAAVEVSLVAEAGEPTKERLSPEALFQQVSKSVFIVEGLGPDGRVVTQGSGVVVAAQGIATNCHVVVGTAAIRIRRGTMRWDAVVAHVHPSQDLCQLHVPGLSAPSVAIRSSTAVQPGERVYAVGAPQGLELTISEGIVSGIREHEGIRLIQTTAPISPGSSGGGLFDANGRLIGLTTFLVKEAQNLNFAYPGELIAALPSYPSRLPPKQAGQRKHWEGKPKTKEEDRPSRLDAWVLWVHNLSVPPNEEEWNVLSAWETKAACEADKKLRIKGVWNLHSPPNTTVGEAVKGKEDYLIVAIKDKYFRTYEWSCFPDAIDPRKPGQR